MCRIEERTKNKKTEIKKEKEMMQKKQDKEAIGA